MALPDWLPKLFTKSEGTVREATTKKFSDFTRYDDTTDMEVVGLKNGNNARAPLVITTSQIATEPEDFVQPTDGETLDNQKQVNRFLWEQIQSIEVPEGGAGGEVDLEGYATEEYVDEAVASEANTRRIADEGLQKEIEDLAEVVGNIDVPDGVDLTGYATEEWVNEQLDALGLDEELTDEEKARRLKAPLQYRGYLEMDADGKPIAPWDEVFLDENEFGVDREVGGWFGHSTAGFQYGRWDMRDCDWIWLVSDNLAEAYENNDYQAIDTAWKVTPKNVGDTFALEMLNLALDTWEDDQGFYFFKGTQELEFRVEEIYWPEHPKGWTNSYAPMVRVSQVRDRDFYRYYLPEKPEYNFDGEKAVSAHLTNLIITNNDLYATKDDLDEAIEGIEFPEGVDLDGYATEEWVTEQIDAIDIPDGVDLTPVEERLDTIEGVLPKAPAVIPPVEVGPQTLEITGSRPTGSGGKAEAVLMWKAEAGSGGSPYNECKLVIPDKSVIDVDATSIWWKQGDKVQRWDMNGAGWFTNTNVLHYSAVETSGDTLVNGQPVELYYIDPNTAGDDLIDAISRLESKADDRKLQAEIEVLSGQLSTLVKSQEDGEWEYKGELPEVPRQPGQFVLATSTLTSELNSVHIQETDLGGITHNFTASVGSYIEIVDIDDPLDYVLFEVTDEPNGTGLISIDVKMVKAGNSFDLDDRCIIRFFEVSEGLDINELDRRYLKLAGGTMKGDLNLSGNLPSIGYTDDQGQNWIQLRFGTTTEYKGWYSTDDAIATRKRVETAVAGLASESWVTEQIEAIEPPEIPEATKSITSTQMMMYGYTYWDMPAGRFTLIKSDQSTPTMDPSQASGVRIYPAQEWWEDTHEPIAGGYISVVDPFDGRVVFGGKVDRVEKDNSASFRWSFFVPFGQYRNGTSLNSDRQFLITLSGCLREK